ncbi:hypothetical protein ACVWW6_008774 [Bradyrhizobium sp. USDA 3311]
MVSRASRRSPLCHAPLTSVASDSPDLLCWTCPAGGPGHADDLHSSCQVTDGNSYRFCVFFVDFPTCTRFDRSIQPIHRGLPILVPHRVFDGAGERFGAKFLMRIRSTFAAIEPFGSVAGMWAFDLCHAFGRLWPRGRGAFGAPFAICGGSGSREQPQSAAVCTRWPTTPSRSLRRAFGVWLAPQINMLAGMLLTFARCLRPIQYGSCWSRRRLDGGRAR